MDIVLTFINTLKDKVFILGKKLIGAEEKSTYTAFEFTEKIRITSLFVRYFSSL